MTNTPNPGDQAVEAVAVTQADRDAAADVWRDYVAKVGEVMAERAIREGRMDDGGLVWAFARHRLSAIPPAADHTDLIARLNDVTGVTPWVPAACNHQHVHNEGWETVCDDCGFRYAADGGA